MPVLLGKHPKQSSTTTTATAASGATNGQQADNKTRVGENILIRFYKRYMVDNSEQNYDCDNFSKL